jgi:hypothetical protein
MNSTPKKQAALAAWQQLHSTGKAAEHPNTPIARIQAKGVHLVAQNDRNAHVHPAFVGVLNAMSQPIAQPEVIDAAEAERLAADRAADADKAARWHQDNDERAMRLQLEQQQ